MPRGGARLGSGRKPKNPGFEVLDGGAALVEGAEDLRVPPEDLPAGQCPYWTRYAPLAIERRTLVPATAPTLRLLCELEVERQAVKDTIDRDGRTYIKCVVDGAGNEHQELKAHPLKSDYAKLSKQVETLLARFLLAPFGKPAGGSSVKTKAEQQKAAARSQFFGVAKRA